MYSHRLVDDADLLGEGGWSMLLINYAFFVVVFPIGPTTTYADRAWPEDHVLIVSVMSINFRLIPLVVQSECFLSSKTSFLTSCTQFFSPRT